MDWPKINYKQGTLVGVVALVLALSACSGMSTKEKEAAKRAQQEQIAKLKAKKKAEEEAKKKAKIQKEIKSEDELVVTPFKETTTPKAQELPPADLVPQPVDSAPAPAPAPAATPSAPAPTATPPATTPTPLGAPSSSSNSNIQSSALVASKGSTDSSSKLAIPTQPNTYLITEADKNYTHPLFGQGSSMGFVVNGQQGHFIVVRRGVTTTFEVRTGVRHDFYLTTSPMGWGADAYTDGVKGQFTYHGDVTFTPTINTPNVLYYGCRNHNSMGGKIVVVDADADVKAITAKLEKQREATIEKNKSIVVEKITPEKLQQKLGYIEMLLKVKGGLMEASHKAQVLTMLAMARNQQSSGNLKDAYASARSAVALFNQSPVVGPTPEELKELSKGFQDELASLEYFVDAHRKAYEKAKKETPKQAIDYDRDYVARLVIEAKKLAEGRKFDKARKRIIQAESLVSKAIVAMEKSKTIVYDIKFKTKEDEYKYEVKRFNSYLELIPTAINVKKPSKSTIDLANKYVNKGKFFQNKSKVSAAAGRWDEAIVVVKDGTTEIRRALRLLGVSM